MKSRSILLLLVCAVLFIAPFLLWGNTYLVGGDDTRLYYVFPLEFLKNYTFNIISDNTLAGAMTGYSSVAYFAPVFFTIWILKFIPFLNTQMVMYGLNLAVGFFAFYKLLGLWTMPKNTNEHAGNILASIFYVTSIYLIKTVYSHQLLSIYLVSVIPATLYLFFKGMRDRSVVPVLLSVMVFSFFSSTINTLPWSAAILIVLLPLLFYEFLKQKKIFIIYSCIFVLLFFLLNFYWIFHLIYPYFHHGGLQNMFEYYSSANFVNDNIRIITGVASLYSSLNVPFVQMDTQFLTNFSFATIVQSIFFICIIVAGLFAATLKKEKTKLYFISLVSFLLAWFFFSPNIGSFGTIIFLFFSDHIPFFTMFRNMYDKFALPLSFTYAFALAISLHFIFEKIRSKWISLGVLLVLSGVLLGMSITNGSYLQKQINPQSTFSGEFNTDYTQMVSYLNSLHNASRVAWIPLNAPTYTSIEDAQYPGHFYSGLSPLRELANMSDYAGRFSFITQTDLFLGDKIFTLLDKGKYQQVGEILQQRNTKYLIVDHQLPPVYLQSFYYGGNDMKLLSNQGSSFQKIVLGNKIKDFGARYSLYKINSRFENDKIYLTEHYDVFPKTFDNLSYQKLNSYSYRISISHLDKTKKLVFLDPYYKDWTLRLQASNGTTKPYEQNNNALVFGYANGWTIDPNKITQQYEHNYYIRNPDRSINITLVMDFAIQKYSYYAYIISGLTALVMLGYILFTFLKRTKRAV